MELILQYFMLGMFMYLFILYLIHPKPKVVIKTRKNINN